MLNPNKPIVFNKFNYDIEYFPEPDMLGTLYVGSDRYAVVCISVDSPKRITVATIYSLTEDNVENNPHIITRQDGVMFIDNINNFKTIDVDDFEKWSLRTKNNGHKVWKKMGKDYSGTISWGIANPYRDPDY